MVTHLSHWHVDSVIVVIIDIVLCIVVTGDGAVLGDMPLASPDFCELLC